MGWWLAALSVFSTVVLAQTSIQVSLKPAWNATSILVEASEYFGRQSGEAYWDFFHAVLLSGAALDSEEAEYRLALDVAQTISGPAVAEVLKYSLSIRNFSPTAELYRQLFQQALLRNQALHSTSLTAFDNCDGVIDVGDRLLCVSADNVASMLGNSSFTFTAEPFDHVFPSLSGVNALALYGSLKSTKFLGVHNALIAFGETKEFTYIFRPLVPASDRLLSLSGFGIELAQKNMEYKVLDDKKIVIDEDENVPSIANLMGAEAEETDLGGFFFNKLLQRRPDLKEPLSSFRDELLAAQKDEGKIKAWDMKDLGIQSSQSIIRAKDPLVLLRDLAQNFPMFATSLTKLRVNKTIVNAFTNRRWDSVTRGEASFMINGVPMTAEELDIFQLHNILQQEAQIADELRLLKLPSSALAQVRAIPRPSAKSSYFPTKDAVRVNTACKGAEEAVTWLNDITTDSRYTSWPRSLGELLQPGWPGQLRYVRKNMYTGVAVADPSTSEGLRLFERANFFVENSAPVKVGFSFVIPSASEAPLWPEQILPAAEWKEFVPETATKADGIDNTPAALIAKLYRWFTKESSETGVGFLKALHSKGKDFTSEADIKAVFKSYYSTTDLSERADTVFDTVLKSKELDEYITHCKTYVSNLGLTHKDGPALFVNGMYSPVPASADFRSVLVDALLGEQRYFTQLVKDGTINDYMNPYAYFLSSPNAVPRLASHVTTPASEVELLNFLPKWKLDYYFSAEKEFLVKVASYWCVGDFNSPSGLALAAAALEHLSTPDSPYNSRIALLHNPVSASGTHLFARFSEAALAQLSPTKALPLVRKAAELCLHLHGDDARVKQALLHLIATHPKLKEKVQNLLRKALDNTTEWQSQTPMATLNVAPGERKIISNGRPVVLPEHATKESLVGDFLVLDQFENVHRKGDAIFGLLQDITFTDMNPDDITSAWVDEVALRIAFLVAKRASVGGASSATTMTLPEFAEDEIGVVRFKVENALLRVVAVLDPLSKTAQRVAPFLLMLRDQLKADVTLVLNPPEFISSFPLKRFYRYAVPSALNFNEHGMVVKKSGVLFRNLITKSTLTLTIDTPEAWMVGSSYAPYDLDNLRLSEIQQDNVYVEFDLKHLLLTGQCSDPSAHEPPAGLQLDLATETGRVQADTLVMANLGYFQLQANPGLWYLNLHGAANTIYKISKGVVPLGGQYESMKITISAFDEPMRSLAIERRPGQEHTKLSDLTMASSPTSAPKKGGFFSSLFGGSEKNDKAVVADKKKDETIHVFSVASGHLYERFLKIMMLSVIRSTKSPVKFWFIENFFSPQFKEFVPRMAEKYGYDVQFVTYKWPEWLRRQEEKQRVIWGYKILFLDVLFPLDLKKVIYIDADQVVRGDLKELWDMDLRGAPYAYTPFCNSNPDTEGFRFWKQGYWRDQLRGRPYHISALYVVDLLAFRKLRAGDSLRMVYDNLSQDPNSLANLDQDLPNYAQSMVPIFSLPQEWLWCQAWCSMETLSTAKTIDLCNNPLTKRPKLEVAKELLPEWETLDKEASELTHTFIVKNATTHEDL